MIKLIIVTGCLLITQVAAAQTCNDTIPASTPESRFVFTEDEVTDTETGLIWRRCSQGQNGKDCSEGNANFYSWQQALETAGSPWRLPNINELESIVEERCGGPSINLIIFPNTVSSNYWSASPHAANLAWAWSVSFSSGISQGGPMNVNYYVRLVRGGP